MNVVSTVRPDSITPFIAQLFHASSDSHKGQNGKVMIIGGSSLFHAASIWAAEIASHFADMVHFASTNENNEIVQHLKILFRNGMIVPRKELMSYIQEDDVTLIGPGMMRSEGLHPISKDMNLDAILTQRDESLVTRELTRFALREAPEKRFVLDAGALQMMDPVWLTPLKQPAIVTPHQEEFRQLFGVDPRTASFDQKVSIVKKMAAKYHCVIILKAVIDIVSDGNEIIVIEGGNAGLTKGGTGDVLAGMIAGLYAKNAPVVAATVASYLLKRTAERVAQTKGLWYNTSDLIQQIPANLAHLVYNHPI